MKKAVLCVGELLIDFICSDVAVPLSQSEHFVKKAGGAPANVAAAIVKLGGQAAFAGKVGKDPFGLFLKNSLEELGVDTTMLVEADNSRTTLAFVSIDGEGERDFIFYRGADAHYSKSDLDWSVTAQFPIVHFGSATALLGGDLGETYLSLMEHCHNHGQFVSFDPNYRRDLWKGQVDEFRVACEACLAFSDFVKVSLEEAQILTRQTDLSLAVEKLHALGARVVVVTMGKGGALLSTGQQQAMIPSILVKAVDSTGAGDAFVGAVLYSMLQYMDSNEQVENFTRWKSVVGLANQVGAYACSQLGGIAALPSRDDLEGLFDRQVKHET